MWKLNNAASVIEMYEEDRSEAANEIERLRAASERELKARQNYTDEDYIRLHNAHCCTAIKLATATAHAERLEATLRKAREAWSRYEKFLDLTGTATDIVRAYNDLCAALSPAPSKARAEDLEKHKAPA
jgi:succinate dehydrogenase/fumarate reductase flavoprotein subunit